jgi:hypothetical protein
MMTGLHQAWIWLSRIGHCRGFGIQSPTDYRFVRYVVNEHWPYYAYAHLGKDDDRLRRKLGRLCFRLANHLQPKAVADLTELYAEYLMAGCKKAYVTHALTDDATFVIAPPTESMGALLARCGNGTTLMVEDIGHHASAWQQVMDYSRATVTFNLYYCGIAFFDPQRQKKNYIVNF